MENDWKLELETARATAEKHGYFSMAFRTLERAQPSSVEQVEARNPRTSIAKSYPRLSWLSDFEIDVIALLFGCKTSKPRKPDAVHQKIRADAIRSREAKE